MGNTLQYEKYHSFFINIMAELDLKKDTETFLDTTITLNEVLEKFQYNPSIKRIRDFS